MKQDTNTISYEWHLYKKHNVNIEYWFNQKLLFNFIEMVGDGR